MSSKLFQGIIYQLKDTVGKTVGVLDENGVVISCSDLSKIGTTRQEVRDELIYTADVLRYGGSIYRPLGNGSRREYTIFVDGEDAEAEELVGILSVTLSSIKNLYDDKYDKSSFIKNVVLENILPGDIYLKSKELHFSNEARRVVLIIKFNGKNDVVPFQMVQNMFPDKNKDFVISVGENDIVLVKEVRPDSDFKTIEKMAQTISDTISTEYFTKVTIGIGSIVDSIKELSRSYKEAQTSIEVGKIFDNEKNILSYEYLGIGRLVYQLPTTLCELFLSEVFDRGSLDNIDKETLQTIQAFFDNNLNVSETARKLYVHRNTLVYRLEKVRKITGLDLREFDHAITFKVALMVKKYLMSKPAKY